MDRVGLGCGLRLTLNQLKDLFLVVVVDELNCGGYKEEGFWDGMGTAWIGCWEVAQS